MSQTLTVLPLPSVVIAEPVEPVPPVPRAFEDGAAVVPEVAPAGAVPPDFDELHAEAMSATAAAADVRAMSLRCMPFSLEGEGSGGPTDRPRVTATLSDAVACCVW